MSPRQPAPTDPRLRLLIVDDDRLMLAMLSDVFMSQFEITTASGGEAALEMLEQKSVAAVLCDHVMPGLTGVEVLARARELQPSAVRILITASEDVETIRDAVNLAHVQRVIAKPVHPVEVEGIVLGAIHERELELENERLVAELKAALAEVKAREVELERELKVRTDELRDVLRRVRGYPTV